MVTSERFGVNEPTQTCGTSAAARDNVVGCMAQHGYELDASLVRDCLKALME
jgi:hypothetical protein